MIAGVVISIWAPYSLPSRGPPRAALPGSHDERHRHGSRRHLDQGTIQCSLYRQTSPRPPGRGGGPDPRGRGSCPRTRTSWPRCWTAWDGTCGKCGPCCSATSTENRAPVEARALISRPRVSQSSTSKPCPWIRCTRSVRGGSPKTISAQKSPDGRSCARPNRAEPGLGRPELGYRCNIDRGECLENHTLQPTATSSPTQSVGPKSLSGCRRQALLGSPKPGRTAGIVYEVGGSDSVRFTERCLRC